MIAEMEIDNKIKAWLQDKLEVSILPKDVIAINFGIQEVYDGYEIYQEGCDDFNENYDDWRLNVVYEPKDNYLNLGPYSLSISQKDVYDIYRKNLIMLINDKGKRKAHLRYVTITYFLGHPELLKRF